MEGVDLGVVAVVVPLPAPLLLLLLLFSSAATNRCKIAHTRLW
jgi:hypothetical protein